MKIGKNKNKKESLRVNYIDEYIEESLNNRTTSYYLYYRKFFSIFSYFCLSLSIIFTMGGMLTIEKKNNNQTNYITNVFGNNIEYVQTEKRQKIVNEFLNHQRGGNNE